ncbi:hypothetical protein Tco_1575654 [Tanacetum coccineum]
MPCGLARDHQLSFGQENLKSSGGTNECAAVDSKAKCGDEESEKVLYCAGAWDDSLERVAVSLLNHTQQEDHDFLITLCHYTNSVVFC